MSDDIVLVLDVMLVIVLNVVLVVAVEVDSGLEDVILEERNVL